MKKILIFAPTLISLFILSILVIPAIGYAAGGGCADSLSKVTDFKCFVEFFRGLINQAIILVIGIAILLFIVGLLKYILAGGDEAKVKEARSFIVFGLIAIFVMMSVWGLVHLLTGVFFEGPLPGPQFKES